MNIKNLLDEYEKEGLLYDDALAKACQDIILHKIYESDLTEKVTIKGGVVLMNLSRDNRRATRDLDLDFIKYSLADASIEKFINKLNKTKDNVKLEIKLIEPLKHEDYKGKRVIATFNDEFDNHFKFKLDVGVHKNLELEQEELYFDLGSGIDSVTLLVNSKEQIIAEKLKSLLKIGAGTRRAKDIFDIYYLTQINEIDEKNLKLLLVDYILLDEKMRENSFYDIYRRLDKALNDKRFYNKMKDAKSNWLELPIEEVISKVLNFFENLETVTV